MTISDRIEYLKDKLSYADDECERDCEVITEQELRKRGLRHHNNRNTNYVLTPYQYDMGLSIINEVNLDDLYIIAPPGYWWVYSSEKIGGFGYDGEYELHPIGCYGDD